MLEGLSNSIAYWTSFFDVREYLGMSEIEIELFHSKYDSSSITLEKFMEALQLEGFQEKELIAAFDKQIIRYYKIQVDEYTPFYEHDEQLIIEFLKNVEQKHKIVLMPILNGKYVYMEGRSQQSQ